MNQQLLAAITNPAINPEIGSGGVGKGTVVIGGLVGAITGVLFIFAFILAFLYLILGAFSWITAGGDKGKLEEARSKITSAVIGLIIVAAVWAIMNLVAGFLGLSFPEMDFPTLPDLINSGTASKALPNIQIPVIQVNGNTYISN